MCKTPKAATAATFEDALRDVYVNTVDNKAVEAEVVNAEVKPAESAKAEVEAVEPAKAEVEAVEPAKAEVEAVEPAKAEVEAVEPAKAEAVEVETKFATFKQLQEAVGGIHSQLRTIRGMVDGLAIIVEGNGNRQNAAQRTLTKLAEKVDGIEKDADTFKAQLETANLAIANLANNQSFEAEAIQKTRKEVENLDRRYQHHLRYHGPLGSARFCVDYIKDWNATRKLNKAKAKAMSAAKKAADAQAALDALA